MTYGVVRNINYTSEILSFYQQVFQDDWETNEKLHLSSWLGCFSRDEILFAQEGSQKLLFVFTCLCNDAEPSSGIVQSSSIG